MDRITVDSLARPAAIPAGTQQWFFCSTRGCPVAWFSGDGATIRKEDALIRIGAKEEDPPHPVCYCFGHTEESIREEIQRTGRSTAFDSIKKEVEAGRCACKTRNPKGTCCLADVRRATEAASGASASCEEPVADDCCAPQPDEESAPATPDTRERAGDTGGSRGLWAAGGSLLAAIAASACCWLPLLLMAVGVSAAGASAAFESLRPWFLGMASVLLGFAFYTTYFRRRACAAGASCDIRPAGNRLRRTLLWVSAVMVAIVAFFPSWIGMVLDAGSQERTLSSDTRSVTLVVEGMHCEGCKVTVERELSRVPGVVAARVDYASRTATVHFRPENRPSFDDLAAAVAKAGYHATIFAAKTPEDSGATDRPPRSRGSGETR